MAVNTRKESKRIPLQKAIWCKLRYWQSLQDISDSDLACYLGCSERTLHNYDIDPSTLTLKTVDSFLLVNDMTLSEFLTSA